METQAPARVVCPYKDLWQNALHSPSDILSELLTFCLQTQILLTTKQRTLKLPQRTQGCCETLFDTLTVKSQSFGSML